jgi:hypothetical protein
MQYHLRSPGLGFLLFLVGCQPIAGRVSHPGPTETYIHAPSRFAVPSSVAGFAREAVKRYDREGRDVSVGYNRGQAVAMTVYVYPVPQGDPDSSLEGYFQACKREVLGRHQGVQVLSENQVTASPGGQKQTGWRAAFTYTDRFAHQLQAVHSELYLFAAGPWFVKYRVSYPSGQEATAEPVIKDFIEELIWPDGGKG